MKAILIDDEKHALDALQDVLKEFGQVDIVRCYRNPLTALAEMNELEFDVVFLDIDMPGVSGLEMAEKIVDLKEHAQIVFITAYDQYAVEAFELNAIDYLLKPVRHGRMAKTIGKLQSAVTSIPSVQKVDKGNIECFRSFRLVLGEHSQVQVKWRTNKVKELFAYFVHYRSQNVHKEKIVDDLWPELDPQRSTTYLHTCVYQIRKLIKAYGVGQQLSLDFYDDSYLFNVHGMNIDVEEFQKTVDKCNEMRQLSALQDAIAMYRGHYLEEHDYAWSVSLQGKLFLAYVKLVRVFACRCMADNRYSVAIEYLLEMLRRDPYQEEGHKLVLQCYTALGDHISAVKHYRRMEAQFREELGVGVNPEIQQLYFDLCDG